MQIIENSKVKEKVYIEKLENGLTVMIIPKKGVQKKYVIWGTNYGSNDSKFIVPGEEQETEVPKGVAHFLEHKMCYSFRNFSFLLFTWYNKFTII